MSAGNAIASVRGTIFGVQKNAANAVITLKVGKLEMTDLNENPLTIAGSVGGIFEVTDGGAAKKITVEDSISPGGSPDTTLNPASTTVNASLIGNWNADPAVRKIRNFRILRTSAGVGSIFFKNDQKFVSVGIDVPSSDEDAPSLRPLDVNQSNVQITFNAHEMASFPSYPEGDASSEFVSLPLKFCFQNGKCVKKSTIIPRTGEIDYDEEALPEGWKTDCPTGTSWFLRLGCQKSELVGFAPYQKEKDLYMYARSGRKLPIATAKVAATDSVGGGYRAGF